MATTPALTSGGREMFSGRVGRQRLAMAAGLAFIVIIAIFCAFGAGK